MSQDTAFETSDNQKETFQFDESKETAPDSLTNAENKEEEATDTSASPVGTEDDEQKVPYSRFKRKIDEISEMSEKINFLERSLSEMQQSRTESTDPEDIDLPKEWVKLYGDSDLAKEAYLVQLRREEQIQERAVQEAIERISKQQQEEVVQVEENEEIIDDNLEALQEAIGKKLTARQEEEILSIVDEFSPDGSDGKYVALFPFDKAYEVYTLRNSQKGMGTRRARESVADLTNTTSQEEGESGSTYRRGWDSWREAL